MATADSSLSRKMLHDSSVKVDLESAFGRRNPRSRLQLERGLPSSKMS
jgi:hypothetical protein